MIGQQGEHFFRDIWVFADNVVQLEGVDLALIQFISRRNIDDAVRGGGVSQGAYQRRAWAGLGLCVIGGIVIGYTPPGAGGSEYFYLGIAFAFLAAFGWAAEGVCVTSGMDFVEPTVALNIYQITSTILYTVLIIPGVLLYLTLSDTAFSVPDFLGGAFTSAGLPFIMLAGIIGCTSYCCWYKAMNMTGVSRAMALNITYSLWGVLFSALVKHIEITRNLVVGSVVIFIGMFLVIGNPKDIVNLRNVG